MARKSDKAHWHGASRRRHNKTCLRCMETWEYDDYVCPCCGMATVDADSDMEPTLRYEFPSKGKYDVIRISTGKSVFSEPSNYLNEED